MHAEELDEFCLDADRMVPAGSRNQFTPPQSPWIEVQSKPSTTPARQPIRPDGLG